MDTHQPRTIEQLINARPALLTRIVKLDSALQANHQDLAEILRCRLCDDLIDYCSRGHFQIFESHSERTISATLAALSATTDAMIRFSETFGEAGVAVSTELRGSLARLADVLDTRFDIEDQYLAGARSNITSAVATTDLQSSVHSTP